MRRLPENDVTDVIDVIPDSNGKLIPNDDKSDTKHDVVTGDVITSQIEVQLGMLNSLSENVGKLAIL